MTPDSLIAGEPVDVDLDSESPIAFLKTTWCNADFAMPVRLAAATGAMPYLLRRKAAREATQIEAAKLEEERYQTLMFMVLDALTDRERGLVEVIYLR